MSERPQEAFPLSWPTGWPRTASHLRKRATFKTREQRWINVAGHPQGGWYTTDNKQLTVYTAMRRLTDELDRLGARNVLLSSNIELRLDGQPRSNQKPPADPGIAVYFKLNGKDRVLACDKWDRAPDNIAAIAAHVDCIRGIDRYGVGTLDQAFAGYAALPPPGHIHKRAWRDVFDVSDDAQVSRDYIEGKYRRLAMTRHPDNGGSHAQMAELNEAIADARRELSA